VQRSGDFGANCKQYVIYAREAGPWQHQHEQKNTWYGIKLAIPSMEICCIESIRSYFFYPRVYESKKEILKDMRRYNFKISLLDIGNFYAI